MDNVTLGGSGLEVSPIAFGTWQLSPAWGGFDEQEATAAIRYAREQGVNFFDTAQAYGFGESERALGRALRDDLDHRRDEVIIATKGGVRVDENGARVRDSSPQWLRDGLGKSLEALGVDYIDLYQVHWPDSSTPFAETGEALQQMVDEGKLRHVGVSNFGPAQIDELSRTRPVETLQPPYAMLRREIETDILPYCAEHDIGVFIYGPLAHGLLTGTMSPGQEFAAGDWRARLSEFRGEDLARGYHDMAAQPVRIEVHIHLGIEFTSASSARARFRSMTMLRKPFLRLTFTFGPSCSRQSRSSALPSALSHRPQVMETRPLGTEKAPNFPALAASSCSANPRFCAASGLSATAGPSIATCPAPGSI